MARDNRVIILTMFYRILRKTAAVFCCFMFLAPVAVSMRAAAEDIAAAIAYIVTRPRHVAVNEILVRPTEQA